MRIFFLLVALWVFGRLAWEDNFTVDPVQVRLAEQANSDQSIPKPKPNRVESSIISLSVKPLIAKPGKRENTIKVTPFLNPTRTSKYHQIWSLSPAPVDTASPRLAKNSLMPRKPAVTISPSEMNIHRVPLKTAVLQDKSNPPSNSAKLSKGHEERTKSPFSGYFWFFAREGSASVLNQRVSSTLQSAGVPYGGSQIGAILNYRLFGDRKRDISLYSRVSAPISINGGREVAIGAKVKPVRNLPVSLFAEGRFYEDSLENRATAFFVAGGTGPEEIAPDLLIETYGQAGYVFRDDSSYFFDGSASLQKRIISGTAGEISLGGAIWGGGQKNVQRLDVGPRVNVNIPMGSLTTRVSVDWRQRVAGNAEPDSGLAVSLSASF